MNQMGQLNTATSKITPWHIPRTGNKAVTACTAASLTDRRGQAMLQIAAELWVRRVRIRDSNGQSAELSGAAIKLFRYMSGSALMSRIDNTCNKHATMRMLGRREGTAWVHHSISSCNAGETAEDSCNAQRAAHCSSTGVESFSSTAAVAAINETALPWSSAHTVYGLVAVGDT